MRVSAGEEAIGISKGLGFGIVDAELLFLELICQQVCLLFMTI